jgi:hypothetical protein
VLDNTRWICRYPSDRALYTGAMSFNPLTLGSLRSNKRYNNFQTQMTIAAAQAHEAAITRPREYRGASVRSQQTRSCRVRLPAKHVTLRSEQLIAREISQLDTHNVRSQSNRPLVVFHLRRKPRRAESLCGAHAHLCPHNAAFRLSARIVSSREVDELTVQSPFPSACRCQSEP